VRPGFYLWSAATGIERNLRVKRGRHSAWRTLREVEALAKRKIARGQIVSILWVPEKIKTLG